MTYPMEARLRGFFRKLRRWAKKFGQYARAVPSVSKGKQDLERAFFDMLDSLKELSSEVALDRFLQPTTMGDFLQGRGASRLEGSGLG